MAASRREIAHPCSSDDDDGGGGAFESDGDGFSFHPICDHSRRGPRALQAFDSLVSALQHDVSNHGFDIVSHLPSSGDEDAFFDGAIWLVNKSRQFVKESEGKRMDQMALGRESNSESLFRGRTVLDAPSPCAAHAQGTTPAAAPQFDPSGAPVNPSRMCFPWPSSLRQARTADRRRPSKHAARRRSLGTWGDGPSWRLVALG